MSSVIIAGSANMDIVAFGNKLPAAGETVFGNTLSFFPGGKGLNQAVAAARAGAPTRFAGCLGQDDFGNSLESILKEAGVTPLTRRTDQAATGTALIIVSDDDNQITVIPGANALMSPDDIAKISVAAGDVLVSQFEIPTATIEAFFAKGGAVGAQTILNPSPFKDIPPVLAALVDILIVNEIELAQIAGVDKICTQADAADTAAHLIATGQFRTVIATLGNQGVVWVTTTDKGYEPPHKVKVTDTTGAGDCFAGVFAAALAKGENIAAAAKMANRAAAISVTRKGAASSSPRLEEILAFAA